MADSGAKPHSLRVCVGSGCSLRFSYDLLAEAEDVAPPSEWHVAACGCLGSCEVGPNVSVDGQVVVDASPDTVRRAIADRG